MRINTIDNRASYKSQYRLAFSNFFLEFINFVPELFSAFLTNSIIVWADCFNSFMTTSHFFIVFIATRQMIKDNGDKYNFGMDRLEITVSFICDLFLIVGYLVVILISLTQLRSPVRPSDAIALFLALKAINIAADVFFYIQGKLVQKKHPSRLNETETAKLKNELIEDIFMAVLVSFCFFFRNQTWSWYVSPAASILFAVVFSLCAAKRMRETFREMSDVSATVEKQNQIFDILLDYASFIDRIIEVNCHFLNHNLLVDINVAFKKDVTYAQQLTVLREISEKADDATLRFVIENSTEISPALIHKDDFAGGKD